MLKKLLNMEVTIFIKAISRKELASILKEIALEKTPLPANNKCNSIKTWQSIINGATTKQFLENVKISKSLVTINGYMCEINLSFQLNNQNLKQLNLHHTFLRKMSPIIDDCTTKVIYLER